MTTDQQLQESSAAVRRVGVWSAILTALWIVLFNIAVLLGALGLPTRLLSVAASLLIALSFLILTSTVHHVASASQRLWTHIGLSFAIVYATLAALNYFLQLTVVRQDPAAYAWLSMQFTADTAFWALEVLLYTFQGLAAALITPVFAGRRFGGTIRWLLIVNAIVTLLALPAYIVTGNPLHMLVMASLGVYAVALPVAFVLCALALRDGESKI